MGPPGILSGDAGPPAESGVGALKLPDMLTIRTSDGSETGLVAINKAGYSNSARAKSNAGTEWRQAVDSQRRPKAEGG